MLVRLLAEPPFDAEEFVRLEDPPNNPVVECVITTSGSFLVLPGLAEEPTFVLRHLDAALYGLLQQPNTGEFTKSATNHLTAGLVVSDEVVRRAGLVRGVEPTGSLGEPVMIPPRAELERLRRAVSFSRSQFDDLLGRYDLGIEHLAPLVADLGSPILRPSGESSRSAVLRRPILRHGDLYVVAVPGAIPAALRHAVLVASKECGVSEELCMAFLQAMGRTTELHLGALGCLPLPIRLPLEQRSPLLGEMIVGLDTDKVGLVHLATDDLAGYDDGDINGEWDAAPLFEEARERLSVAEEYLFERYPEIKEVLHILLLQPLGRAYAAELGARQEPVRSYRLPVTAGDLETIAMIEDGHLLTLWQYARASEHLAERIYLRRFGELDQFHLYRERGYGFDLYPLNQPVVTALLPGGDGELRRAVQRKWNPHGVLHPGTETWVQVITLYGDPAQPIYIPYPQESAQVVLLVESLPLPVWILGPAELLDPRYEPQYMQLAQAVAHWIWRLAPAIEDWARKLAERHTYLPLYLHLVPHTGWFEPLEAHELDDTLRCEARQEGGLDLWIGPGIRERVHGPDNTGERELARTVLRAIDDLHARGAGTAALGTEELDGLLDRYAPLGPGKMLLYLRHEPDPRYWEDGPLPPYREVQGAEQHLALDDLGRYLLNDLRLPVGVIACDDRVRILNTAVGYLFRLLEREVAALSPAGLVEWLVSASESIVHERARREMTEPARSAALGRGVAGTSRTETPEHNTAAVSARLIVEYVTARPPSGLRPMSLAAHDRLVALASEIIRWGSLSDVIRYELSDPELALLPNGRIGVGEHTYRVATEAFVEVHAEEWLALATAAFPEYWEEADAGPLAVSEADLDTATEAEFGVSLGGLQWLLAHAIELGTHLQGACKVMPLPDFVAELTARLGWNAEQVKAAFEVLASRPRASFLAPPAPYTREHTYPWRYNRGLSYVRKPLLVRQTARGEEVVWGIRHLWEALHYLRGLCIGGRLSAGSPEMRKLIGRLLDERGERFNDEVGALFQGVPDARVALRVGNIRGKLQGAADEDLGDIDVLAAIPDEHRLYVVETKDLSVARTAWELRSEIANLFEAKGRRRPAVEKHMARAEWVSRNMGAALERLGLDGGEEDRWVVEPLIVISSELVSPRMMQSPIPIVTYRTLGRRLELI